mmetsp:Transcript_15804/g.21283  ORF Transcript_15804/g.21283 Transcript_15804/m.21283 type:complete len:194 (+) Transcript_15804:588-1169(+)
MILLTNGSMAYQLSSCESGRFMISAEGMMIMGIIILCAAGGNVVTQLFMQKSMEQPLMLQNALLYFWGSIMNGINWLMSLNFSSDEGHNTELLGEFHAVQAMSVVFFAVYGLSISIILKRFGAITRTVIQTVAVIVTALIDLMLFKEEITMRQVTSFVTIVVAVFMSSILAKDYHQQKGTKTEEHNGKKNEEK